MKALELKELIAEIPDNEEVYYGYYSQDYEENTKDDDFDVRLFFEKNGAKFYLIGGPKPCDAILQEEVERAQKWQNIVKSFPQKKHWFLEQETWKNNGGYVNFRAGSFACSISTSIGKNKLIDANFEKRESFDSWEEFFDKAVPYVKKAAGLNGVGHEQGFIDQFGRFYTREEAWIIAETNGQIKRKVSGDGTLYSENLY